MFARPVQMAYSEGPFGGRSRELERAAQLLEVSALVVGPFSSMPKGGPHQSMPPSIGRGPVNSRSR